MKKFDPTKKHIGMIRYADHYHPSNEASQERLRELEEKLHCEFTNGEIPRSLRLTITSLAQQHGFQFHWFEKGLGR